MKLVTGTIQTENVAETLKFVNDIADRCNSSIALIDATKVAGIHHIESAVSHAKRSFAAGATIARTVPMEILVYVSGQRQCSLAAKFGLHLGTNAVYAVIEGGNEEKTAELLCKDIIVEGPVEPVDISTLMREFDITEDELKVTGPDRIEELVMERVAMVDAWK